MGCDFVEVIGALWCPDLVGGGHSGVKTHPVHPWGRDSVGDTGVS